jgi:hypothetical protein
MSQRNGAVVSGTSGTVFTGVTPEMVDVVYEAHKLTPEDRGTPEVRLLLELQRESTAVARIIRQVERLLGEGMTVREVVVLLYFSALRDGWYVRDSQPDMLELDELFSRDEIAEIRKEIRG